jgi:hypothetical protein
VIAVSSPPAAPVNQSTTKAQRTQRRKEEKQTAIFLFPASPLCLCGESIHRNARKAFIFVPFPHRIISTYFIHQENKHV